MYRSSDYIQLERYYEYHEPTHEFIHDMVHTTGVGYIDANTWYFTAVTTGRSGTEGIIVDRTNIHIRSIQPSKEIAKYSFLGKQSVSINNDYVAFSGPYTKYNNGVLVKWRTGEEIPVDVVYPARNSLGHFELTRSNRVLSADWMDYVPNTMLADPFNNKTEELDWYVTFSPDERYAIDFSERRCKLRKLSGKEVAPIQKQEIAGYCSERLTRKADEMYNKWVSFSPDGKSFVVATGRDVRVYRVEPFQLALEIRMPGQVVEAALSDDGWLAVSDKDKFLRLWDVATGNLAGQHQGTYLDLLRFQPGGNKLMAAGSDGITVFALPERTGR